MVAYCTAQQAIDWLGPGNANDPYRELASVDPAADALELGNHGLKSGDVFEVEAKAGTIAGGLAASTQYYAIVLTRSRWQAAATSGGSPVDITDEGENMGVILYIPWDRYIAEEGAYVDDMLIGNAMPLAEGSPVPPLVSRYTSVLVAKRAARFAGVTSVDLSEDIEQARRDLREIYLKGKPLRNQPPPPTNTAVSGPRLSGGAADGRGWNRTNSSGAEVIG